MNSTAYILWNRIKKQVMSSKSTRGICSLDGTLSGIRAANELNDAGFIAIVHINKYELEYKVNYEISD